MSFPDLFEDLEAQKALAQRCLVYRCTIPLEADLVSPFPDSLRKHDQAC